ncbi:DUF2767 family protein [Salmonella enterica]|nr:DUF2767 family protein [Salmonella enterica]EBD4898235.1 DUF2767 family protein [Salmonella enterica]ECW1489984.1 DUF2767 family protein [Salmonella enterica]
MNEEEKLSVYDDVCRVIVRAVVVLKETGQPVTQDRIKLMLQVHSDQNGDDYVSKITLHACDDTHAGIGGPALSEGTVLGRHPRTCRDLWRGNDGSGGMYSDRITPRSSREGDCTSLSADWTLCSDATRKWI